MKPLITSQEWYQQDAQQGQFSFYQNEMTKTNWGSQEGNFDLLRFRPSGAGINL